jgi:hypothetical protein
LAPFERDNLGCFKPFSGVLQRTVEGAVRRILAEHRGLRDGLLLERTSVMKQDNLSVSTLEAVADHERELANRLAEAERQAERLVAEARAAAANGQGENDKRVEEEVAALRREKEDVCERELKASQEASERRLAQLRSSAQERCETIVREVVALVLPDEKTPAGPKEAG